MSESSGGDQGISRRRFTLGALGAVAAAVGLWKAGDLAEAGAKMLEKIGNSPTEAQRQAIEAFNSGKQEIIHTLTTGPDGAIRRSIPEPPRPSDPDRSFIDKWESNKTYPLPYGAIIVRGADPNNTGMKGADWYFIATQRDQKTGKVTGGYFSYSGNFLPSANNALAKGK